MRVSHQLWGAVSHDFFASFFLPFLSLLLLVFRLGHFIFFWDSVHFPSFLFFSVLQTTWLLSPCLQICCLFLLKMQIYCGALDEFSILVTVLFNSKISILKKYFNCDENRHRIYHLTIFQCTVQGHEVHSHHCVKSQPFTYRTFHLTKLKPCTHQIVIFRSSWPPQFYLLSLWIWLF